MQSEMGQTRHGWPGWDRRRSMRNVLFALAWPFVAAVIYFLKFPRTGEYAGLVVFCAYAGYVFSPTFGSDAHTFAMRIQELQSGYDASFQEPVIWLLAHLVAILDVDVAWYFVLKGCLYSCFVVACAKLVFQPNEKRHALSIGAAIFIGGFFLYYPILPALNARFTLGMWACFASVLYWMKGDRKISVLLLAVATGIHYGHSIFALGMALLYASSYLKNYQISFAYFLVLVGLLVPPGLMIGLVDIVAGVVGGSYSEKLEFHAAIGDRRLSGALQTSDQVLVWYAKYWSHPIFWSLMLSGHWIVFQRIKKRSDPLFQLWIFIIILWALLFAVSGGLMAEGRIQRLMTGLLLLFHGLWFMRTRGNQQLIVLFNILPMLFFFVVGYRIWLHQMSLAIGLPLPFGLFADFWPRVMEFLGFGS